MPTRSASAPSPSDEADPLTSRRLLGRTVAAAALAAPILGASTEAQASPAQSAKPRRRRKRKRKWHRCKTHRRHTCWNARTCKHRLHKKTSPTPTPTQPTPTQPTPTQPTPTQPTPTQPTPTQPTPTPIEPTDLPDPGAMHLASRFAYGMTSDLHREMAAAGGPDHWFEAQLNPAAVPDAAADQMQSWWPSINLDAAAIWQRDQAEVEGAWQAVANYQRWCLLRRVYSKRQVLEAATEFFENHLHVPAHDDGVFGFRAAYGKVIRSHALGRFDDMLVAAITHPAMGSSLDNATSTKRAPNENLGRELLELHTVGRGNYTEDDVKNSARILTGYRVEMWSTWKSYYDSTWHWTGPVKVMGFSHANASADGRPVAEAYLRYLAHHPATARRLARKMAVRFVSDTPSEALVSHLAEVYLDNDTAIAPVLRALVARPEFAASAEKKARNPTDDVVATWRALGVGARKPTFLDSGVNSILWQASSIGQAPFGWSRPDGQPEDSASWSSASRLLASFESHYTMCGQWWPKAELTYRPFVDWIPVEGSQTIRFDALVDHISRQLLCRQASARVVVACCLATGLTASTQIGLNHGLVRWHMPLLLTTLLDSPEHMSR